MPKKKRKIYKGLEKILSDMPEEEQKILLKQLQYPHKKNCGRKIHYHYYRPRRVKIGIISDLHIGSKFFDMGVYEKSVRTFSKEKVEAIYCCGDIIEGMSNREGHIYELDHIGTSTQINYAAELLNQYKQPLFFITGNHDEWASRKSNQGVLVGEILEEKITSSTHLGDYETNVELAPGVMMRLTHDGSNAYALSYSLQKRINGLADESKPQILANGHIHKSIYMFYRNIHAVEAGTLQNQTPFMARKGSPAMVGFWIFDIRYGKKGLYEFTPRWFPKE